MNIGYGKFAKTTMSGEEMKFISVATGKRNKMGREKPSFSAVRDFTTEPDPHLSVSERKLCENWSQIISPAIK